MCKCQTNNFLLKFLFWEKFINSDLLFGIIDLNTEQKKWKNISVEEDKFTEKKTTRSMLK